MEACCNVEEISLPLLESITETSLSTLSTKSAVALEIEMDLLSAQQC